MPGGRPSLYCDALAAQIIERMSEGESLRAICRDDGMPHIATVLKWTYVHKEFGEQYAHAMEIRAETMFDEMLEIADESVNDKLIDENGIERTNTEIVARSRLRVDTRKWALSKMMPKKYGDRIQQDVQVTQLSDVLNQVDGTALSVKKQVVNDGE